MQQASTQPRVLFVYVRVVNVFVPSIAALSAYIKSKGFDQVKVLCVGNEASTASASELFADAVMSWKPDIICFSTMTTHWQQISALATEAKQISDATTIVGGYHASLFPEQVIAHDAVDLVCIGEGEHALVEVLQNLEEKSFSEIRSIWSKRDGAVIKNAIRAPIRDLGALPMPDRDIFAEAGINEMGISVLNDFLEGQKVVSLAAGRGCPFKCSFCSNDPIRRAHGAKGGYVRANPVDQLVAEMKQLNERFDPDFFELMGEIFPVKKGWMKDFAKQYKEQIGKPFTTALRVGVFSREEYELLAEAGCSLVYVGLECGNEAYRAEVLNKPIKNETFRKDFEILRELGIRTATFNMVCLPFETRQHVDETIRFNREIAADFPMFFTYQPLPATELFDVCARESLFKEASEKKSHYFSHEAQIKVDISQAELEELWGQIVSLQKETTGATQLVV